MKARYPASPRSLYARGPRNYNHVCLTCRVRFRVAGGKCPQCCGPTQYTWYKVPPKRDVKAWLDLAAKLLANRIARSTYEDWNGAKVTNQMPKMQRTKTWRGYLRAISRAERKDAPPSN